MRVTWRDGLVVTSPPRVPTAAIERFVEENRQWAVARLEERRSRLAEASVVPGLVRFAATGEVFEVEARSSCAKVVRVTESARSLTLRGPVDDPGLCVDGLSRWLSRAARSRLPAMLDEVARREGLRYERVTVRAQSSRWGSCSRTGSLSLNRALLFLEPGLVRHVLLHELVHTVHPDHSPAFWTELGRRDEGLASARARLSEARALVPAWAER